MSDAGTVLLAFLLPIAAAGAAALLGRAPNLRESATLAIAACTVAAVWGMVPAVIAGARPGLRLFEVIPGLAIAFSVEPLGMLFAAIVAALWLVTTVYSIGYLRGNGEAHQSRFYACFALAIAAALGVAFAANAFTMFVFYELLTLVTYPLVTHHGTEEARRGGRTYLGLLLGTSLAFLLPALVATWHVAGTTDFRVDGVFEGVANPPGPVGLGVLVALYVFGIGKAALMPFHRWLPAAMVAPAPVSALLHAVAVVKAGVFCIVKVFVYLFGLDTLAAGTDLGWLALVAGFTILAASVVALRADNLKRRLAYSTVSQLSYVVLAAAVLVPLSVAGAVLHIAAHALGKITLFFAAGAIYTAAHKTEVSQLDGIGRRMPLTMAAFAIGAVSMIGLPPAAGFVGKWYLLSGAMAQAHWVAVAVVAASTLLNAGYFLPILHRAFFRAGPGAGGAGGAGVRTEAPLPILVALSVTATGTLALFFLPDLPLAMARQVAGLP